MKQETLLAVASKRLLKRVIIIIGCIFLGGIVLGITLLWNRIETVSTFHKVDEAPLYVMRYHGDYGFDDLLRKGVNNDRELDQFIRRKLWLGNILQEKMSQAYQCTCFTAKVETNRTIFGRNMDWYDHPALLLFTDPPTGYASVSMVDLYYLGFDKESISKASFIDKQMLLAAPYIPFDGMNEYGLAVASLSVPHAEPPIDKNKTTIGLANAIRLVLDHARDVDEAIVLLKRYNIYLHLNSYTHLFMADASGKSVVVEFLAGKMYVTANKEPWQVVTNFIIYDWDGGNTGGCGQDRYRTAYNILKNNQGKVSGNEAMNILGIVSQVSTLWSAVYNLSNGDIRLVMNMKYNEVSKFKLKMKNE